MCPSTENTVSRAREDTRIANREYEDNPHEINQHNNTELRNKLYTAYTNIAVDTLEEKIKQIENVDLNRKYLLSWELINEINGRKTTQKGMIKVKNQKERLQTWYKHFQDLLGKPPNIEDENETIIQVIQHLEIKRGVFEMYEYKLAKEVIKEGKSCGVDEIRPEVLKRCNIDDIILYFINKALLDKMKPKQWSILNIIPIPKKGDLSLGSNYRGISLTSLVAKTNNHIILNRIRPHLDCHLRKNQNGFRNGRTTTSQILALRRLIEGVKDNNLEAILIFIDFKKAFDTIHRGNMLAILKAYGIPEELVTAISIMYEDTTANVITPDGETFNILAGVLQGDTLAPYLFVIVIDYVMRTTLFGREDKLGFQLRKRKSRRVPPITITDMEFADDIALVS